ncbi:LytR/AlgR family response regulator transcription factor [Pseudoduganella sp. UC29_106]|uniref:LytR/AlgR family response regulator transcription factor n=1 Tax=Pseudoduganella sp. UC29_106 TaxID=3374553 RepID=UPI003757AB6A
MMRVLIVDDERLARAELRRLLAAHPQVEIVGEAANAEEALHQVAALQPDLLLLDVQMPGGSGFDLLQALDAAPDVIFTTAFDQYALRAFEVNALDYLQKPIQAQRLANALSRAALRLGGLPAPSVTQRPQQLFIKDGERCWFVTLDRIRLFESEGNYTRVHFDGEQPLMLRSLNQLEQRLDPLRFFRASRRQIVNLDYVAQLAPADGGGLSITLHDGQCVDVSRRRAAQLKEMTTL